MYYPYLRGKQFDLLALQTLVKAQRWSKKIQPIIEPVRDSATLKNVIQLFDQQACPLFVIQNPQVGTYRLLAEKKYHWHVERSVRSAAIVTRDTPSAELYVFTASSPRQLECLPMQLAEKRVVIPDQGRFRILPFPRKIVLQANFQVRKKVVNYALKDDDFYSDEFLYWQTDGFVGFSDYTIEGSRYVDKGGPSRAIALHITYFDAYLNLRVKHFVSDSNDDARDQAGKFFEALAKLNTWVQKNHAQLLLTLGLEELLAYQQTQKFPGLGTIKKWSLAHHLELIGSYLENGEHYLKGLNR